MPGPNEISQLLLPQTSRADRLQETLENYDKDEEIKERDERIRSLYDHSLVMLSDKELAAAKAFIERHWLRHWTRNYYYLSSMW